jgi:hypothetical protein
VSTTKNKKRTPKQNTRLKNFFGRCLWCITVNRMVGGKELNRPTNFLQPTSGLAFSSDR